MYDEGCCSLFEISAVPASFTVTTRSNGFLLLGCLPIPALENPENGDANEAAQSTDGHCRDKGTEHVIAAGDDGTNCGSSDLIDGRNSAHWLRKTLFPKADNAELGQQNRCGCVIQPIHGGSSI